MLLDPERGECVEYIKNMLNNNVSENRHEYRSDSRVNSSPEYETDVFGNGINTATELEHCLSLSNPNNGILTDICHQASRTANTSGTQTQANAQNETINGSSIDLDDIIHMLDESVNRFDHEEILDSRAVSRTDAPMIEHRISNDVYLDKIEKLSIKVQQQAASIKERDQELKRLRATSIGNSFIDRKLLCVPFSLIRSSD